MYVLSSLGFAPIKVCMLESFFIAIVNWLNPEKSLREQGVDETQVLVLRLV